MRSLTRGPIVSENSVAPRISDKFCARLIGVPARAFSSTCSGRMAVPPVPTVLRASILKYRVKRSCFRLLNLRAVSTASPPSSYGIAFSESTEALASSSKIPALVNSDLSAASLAASSIRDLNLRTSATDNVPSRAFMAKLLMAASSCPPPAIVSPSRSRVLRISEIVRSTLEASTCRPSSIRPYK